MALTLLSAITHFGTFQPKSGEPLNYLLEIGQQKDQSLLVFIGDPQLSFFNQYYGLAGQTILDANNELVRNRFPWRQTSSFIMLDTADKSNLSAVQVAKSIKSSLKQILEQFNFSPDSLKIAGVHSSAAVALELAGLMEESHRVQELILVNPHWGNEDPLQILRREDLIPKPYYEGLLDCPAKGLFVCEFLKSQTGLVTRSLNLKSILIIRHIRLKGQKTIHFHIAEVTQCQGIDNCQAGLTVPQQQGRLPPSQVPPPSCANFSQIIQGESQRAKQKCGQWPQ